MAAMVAAIGLGARFKIAIFNSSGRWGGHFAGIKLGNHQFDLGMNLLEFTSFVTPDQDLHTYNPRLRNDSARFVKLVEDFLTRRVNLAKVPRPLCWLNGEYYADLIISNCLDSLHMLPPDLKNRISLELLAILSTTRHPLHASNKAKNPELFLRHNFEEASLSNQGATFHELFVRPIFEKALNISCAQTPALLHRAAWTPLYYPETLLGGIRGEDPQLPNTYFSYPKNSDCSELCANLRDEILRSENITVVSDPIEAIKIFGHPEFYTLNGEFTAPKAVWSNSPDILAQLLGASRSLMSLEKASVCLAFLAISSELVAKQFSTLFICQGEDSIYRITNMNVCSSSDAQMQKIIVEMNLHSLTERGILEPHDIEKFVMGFLLLNGIITEITSSYQFELRQMAGSLNLPTFQNIDTYNGVHNLLSQYGDMFELIGLSSSFGSTSFNDQVVQGLALNSRYS